MNWNALRKEYTCHLQWFKAPEDLPEACALLFMRATAAQTSRHHLYRLLPQWRGRSAARSPGCVRADGASVLTGHAC